MKKRIYLLMFLTIFTGQLFAQSNLGEIKGKLTDKSTKGPVEFADVLVFKDGIRKSYALSGDQGNYYVKALEPGSYSITVKHASYREAKTDDIIVSANKATTVNFELETEGIGLPPVVVRYKPPIINPNENTKTITSSDIVKLPTRSLGEIANISSGASSTRNGISFIGQRPDATRTFIDGIAVIGSSNLPQAGIGQIDIIQSGVPAQFGDFTGGAISVTTKGPSRIYQKSLEIISSSMFNPYHYNQVEGSLQGPLKIKNKGGGEKEYVAWGYQLAGNINYQKDPDPAYGGMYVIKEDKLKEIEENPLAPSKVGSGFIPRSSYLTQDDLIRQKARRNVAQINSVVQGKLEFQPNRNTTITAYGSFNYLTRNQYFGGSSSQRADYLLNYKQNRNVTDQTYRTYLKFTQRLRSTNTDDKAKGDTSKPLFTDAFYSVRLDYQTRFVNVENPEHGENFFDYGYLGKFTRYRTPQYNYNSGTQSFIDQNGDTVTRTGFWELKGFTDTLLTFQPGKQNRIVSRYTENFFKNAAEKGNKVINENEVIEGQGLLNGMGPQNTYSLWNNPGTVSYFYEKNQTERISAYAMGEASLNLKNRHDLQFGMMYEQNIASRYAIAPFGLWRLMPQLVNGQITLDKRIGINSYDEFGNFLDTVNYSSIADPSQQSTFDKKLRQKLIDTKARDAQGNLYTNTSFIDISSLDPSIFSIDMFSSNELWNNGNTYQAYYGYDYLGNRVRKRPTLNEFLNNKQKRSVGSFAPVYNAVWLQDKFTFKDLIFRLGVRIERYDANQPVLKDPYSLYPIKSAGEVKELNGKAVNHPDNINSDFAVYVNNTDNPTEIVGYRDGSVWYNANGIEVSSADFLANKTTSGRIQPYLVEPENQKLTNKSFTDYTPQINVLPRVWFSFPINTEAQFFANYDVMAQRPPDGATFTPINTYYFLEANSGGTIANSALKPRIRTNYEFGFKQKLGTNSALSIIATYAETKGDFGLIRVNQAYPIAYNTRGNIDFSTTKAFRIEYELQGTGRVSLTANYTLLFADGTGSNINSQAALIAANQPNLRSLYPLDVDIRHKLVSVLDYRFEDKTKYTGPVWFGKKIFADAGVNFIFNARSGAPYSRNKQAVSDAQSDLGRVQRSQIDGNPYGSRMPWQFRVDMNLNKNFEIEKVRKKEGRMPSYKLTAFLWVENLLNQRIVDAVYQFTGLPGDDGYLNSPQGQQYISEQANTQSFIDLYKVKVDNPYNYITPRYAKLGVKMYF